MQWNTEAKEALSKVPFFVRKRVRRRVEEEAARCGADEVGIEHVRACQRRFLESQEDEVKGYQIETCFGPSGCPNRAVSCDSLAEELERLLSGREMKSFLKERVKGPLKMHHEFRISISDCPNACSRPQIVDIGLIGAQRPHISQEACDQCAACVETCREKAVSLPQNAEAPVIDYQRCLSCGQCIRVCPSGTLAEETSGYRILLGGKLGRHPRLGTELPGIFKVEEAVEVIDRALGHHRRHCLAGERFGEILERTGLGGLQEPTEDEKIEKKQILDLSQ